MKSSTTIMPAVIVAAIVSLCVAGCGGTTGDGDVHFITFDCLNPCGAEELLNCMAEAAGYENAEAFWNTVLFRQFDADGNAVQDGFCARGTDPGTETQNYYVNTFCAEDNGTYFSYQNFIDANAEMKSALGSEFDFLCKEGTTKEQRIRDFSNFLAIGAQETTSASAGYTNDGYYWRWEYGALVKCCSEGDLNTTAIWPCSTPSRTCDLQTNIYTQYTPATGYKVAIVPGDRTKVFTQKAWSSVADYGTGVLQGNEMNLASSPNVQSWNSDIAAPDGYELANLSAVVDPYYWVGMGAIQLTADSVMNFFGWYYNNIESPAAPTADLNAFVQRLAGEGKLSFTGALWYWNYRINGSGRPTIETMLNTYGDGAETPCHDIAMSTIMVNGGCNDFDVRKSYYNYFTATVFGITIDTVTHTYRYSPDPASIAYKDYVLGNMKCEVDVDNEPYYCLAFQNYCYSLVQ